MHQRHPRNDRGSRTMHKVRTTSASVPCVKRHQGSSRGRRSGEISIDALREVASRIAERRGIRRNQHRRSARSSVKDRREKNGPEEQHGAVARRSGSATEKGKISAEEDGTSSIDLKGQVHESANVEALRRELERMRTAMQEQADQFAQQIRKAVSEVWEQTRRAVRKEMATNLQEQVERRGQEQATRLAQQQELAQQDADREEQDQAAEEQPVKETLASQSTSRDAGQLEGAARGIQRGANNENAGGASKLSFEMLQMTIDRDDKDNEQHAQGEQVPEEQPNEKAYVQGESRWETKTKHSGSYNPVDTGWSERVRNTKLIQQTQLQRIDRQRKRGRLRIERRRLGSAEGSAPWENFAYHPGEEGNSEEDQRCAEQTTNDHDEEADESIAKQEDGGNTEEEDGE